MRSSATRFATGLALGVASAALMSPAWAQQTPVTQDDSSDVVVITGIGPARAAGELIASTTVLGGEDIAERLSGGLGDTLEGLPGVSTTAFGPGASRPVIRGLGAERVQVLTNGIGVIDASAASPDHAVTGDPLGAERIEILRGPATLAYGGGAAGGVVNVIDGLIVERLPSKPAEVLGYAGYTSVDEGQTYALRGTGTSGPLVGVLSWTKRTSGDLDIPGYAESDILHEAEEAEHGHAHEREGAPGSLENSGVETQSLSGGLSLVGDEAFVGVAVRGMESKYGIVGGHEHHEEEEEPVALAALSQDIGVADIGLAAVGETPELPFIDMKQLRVDIRGGLDIANGPISKIMTSLSTVDYEHTEFEGPGEPGTVFTNNGYEFRLEAQHAEIGAHAGTIGVQTSRRDFRAVGDEAFVTPTITEAMGAFIFETYEMGEWGLEGGLRYDRVDVRNDVQGTRSFDTWNASIGWHGHVLEQLFLGASVNRTERAPNDVELFADGPHLATRQYEVGDQALDTERGVSIEGSARWEAGLLQISGSLYHFAFQDFIYLSPTGAELDELPVYTAVQADADFTGGEITASYQLGEAMGARWTVDAGADIVRAKLDGGGNVPRIPPMSANVGLEADMGFVNARLDVRWADEQDRVGELELPTEGWTSVDLRTTWAVSEQLDLIVEGTNLTDEEIRHHASPLKDLAPMAGRGFRVGLRAGF